MNLYIIFVTRPVLASLTFRQSTPPRAGNLVCRLSRSWFAPWGERATQWRGGYDVRSFGPPPPAADCLPPIALAKGGTPPRGRTLRSGIKKRTRNGRGSFFPQETNVLLFSRKRLHQFCTLLNIPERIEELKRTLGAQPSYAQTSAQSEARSYVPANTQSEVTGVSLPSVSVKPVILHQQFPPSVLSGGPVSAYDVPDVDEHIDVPFTVP